MLHSVELTSIETTVMPLPQSPFQDGNTSLSLYVISPIDPVQIITMQAQLSTGEQCPLLVPVSLPQSILNHPAFRDGYEWNYLSEEEVGEEEEEWTTSVPRLLNHLCSVLTDRRFSRNLTTGELDPGYLSWQVGWFLRDMTRLAQIDQTKAYVGIAHLCFLLSLFTLIHPSDWSDLGASRADFQHDRALKAYRARVRFYRKLGKNYEQAQRLALS